MTRLLYWDICQSHNLSSLIEHVDDPQVVELLSAHLSYFSTSIHPHLKFLRHQPIFNDFNPDNVIVGHKEDDYIRGVIDFGDMVYGPLVADVAVAATYVLFATSEDPVSLSLLSHTHTLFTLTHTHTHTHTHSVLTLFSHRKT